MQKLEAKKPTHRSRLWKFLAFVVGVPGVLAALITFLPRVAVTPTDPVDQKQPYSSSFTVTNTNFIPLHDVGAGIGIIESITEPLEFDERNRPPINQSGEFTLPQWNHHHLGMDEKFTITTEPIIHLAPDAALSGADILVIVHYQPWVIPITQTRMFRFVTHRYQNGTYSWFSYPLK
jgi:hypothetical protein